MKSSSSFALNGIGMQAFALSVLAVLCVQCFNINSHVCWTNQISTDTVAVVDTVLQLRYYTFDATDLLI